MLLQDLFKALGDENRIRIVNLLLEDKLCVCEIEVILNISQSNASRHLNKLKSNGIITNFKEAQWVFYQVNDHFKNEHSLLYQYLKEKTKKVTQCTIDLGKLERYKSSCYTCSQIGDHYQEISKYLDQ